MKTEIEYDLTHPILYKPNNGSEQIEGHKLFLKEPSPKNMVERGLLKQEVSKIVEWIQGKVKEQNGGDMPASEKEEKQEEVDDDIDEMGELIVLGIYGAPGVDIKQVLTQFRKLMVDGRRCSVEDEKDLTSNLFDKIHPEDQDRMMGLYLANFTLPS